MRVMTDAAAGDDLGMAFGVGKVVAHLAEGRTFFHKTKLASLLQGAGPARSSVTDRATAMGGYLEGRGTV